MASERKDPIEAMIRVRDRLALEFGKTGSGEPTDHAKTKAAVVLKGMLGDLMGLARAEVDLEVEQAKEADQRDRDRAIRSENILRTLLENGEVIPYETRKSAKGMAALAVAYADALQAALDAPREVQP